MNLHFHCRLLLTIMTVHVLPHALGNDKPERRVVDLTGEGIVRIPATRARLTVMVESESKSPATAQQVVAQRSTSVRDFLQASNVEQLQAGAIALHPIHENQPPYGPGRSTEITGYRAQWSATFEIDAERAGQIASGVVAAGASRISNFEFTATETALAKAQQSALREAALRARSDAHAVLDSLGYQPGEIERITINQSGTIPLARRVEASAYSGASSQAAPTAVEPGLLEVKGSVTLEVGY